MERYQLPLTKFILPLLLLASLVKADTCEMPTPDTVYQLGKKVADWQIETFEEQGTYRALPKVRHPWQNRIKHHDLDWTNGALYSGMYQWSQISADSRYADWLTEIGERNSWKLHKRPYHADDHTVGQFYLNLYEDTGDRKMLLPTQKHFDWILENPRTGTLVWTAEPTDAHHRWGWCDALFMAPPVWARLAKITGCDKYLEFMDQEYKATYDLLWDEEEKLFWRDSSFFEKREQNGKKIFWSRGNGWVFGGLALMIPDLPVNWEGRDFYIQLFKEMAETLKKIQREDGTWSMGLLGGEQAYPVKETSGTSFYTFGLAWGINNGLLDKETYLPVVLKAWKQLSTCVTEDGMLAYVQPIGAAPGEAYPDYTEVYGSGAFLAAVSEVYKLVGGSTPYLADSSKEYTTFLEDGGWCWYQDPRAIIANGKLLVGGVSGKSGDVKVSVFDLGKKKDLGTVILHEKFQRDDHDTPAFYKRPDGSVLAIYAKHGNDKIHHIRISDPVDYLKWANDSPHTHEYDNRAGVTYMNLYHVEDEDLLYNFYRDGETFNPYFITSSDHGKTWENRTHLIADEVAGRHRPYARYLQKDSNTVGISFTDGHPRVYGNSLYYAELKNGAFYNVDGSKIKDLSNGPLLTSEAQKIFKGSETKQKPKGFESVPMSAWTCAAATDSSNNPHIGYSLYLSNDDHRYRIASWTGEKWIDREIAYAGNCLYTRESSYTGLMAFDPEDPTRVYISTDVHPTTGKDLGGTHEIYTAVIMETDDISSINWQPVTSGSTYRNIRPMVVSGDGHKVLLWLSGPWNTYMDYASDVKGIVLN